MKLKFLLLTFLSLLFLNSAEASKLPDGACRITSEVIKKETWMKTIAIVKLKNNFDNETIDELMKCLPIDITVVLIDTSNFNYRSSRLHKASFVMVIADDISDVSKYHKKFYQLIFNYFLQSKLYSLVFDYDQKPFLDHNSKFLVVTTRSDEVFFNDAKKFLGLQSSVSNFAVLFQKVDKVFIDYNNNHEGSLELDLVEGDLIDKLYPNQFKNANSRHYIAVHSDPPRVIISNGKVYNKYSHFFNSSASMEHSKISYVFVDGKPDKIAAYFQELFNTRRIEFLVSSIFSLRTAAAPKLFTYEEIGSCLLVPKPENVTLAEEIFFLPFDLATWLIFMLSVVVTTVFWRYAEPQTSCWFVPFFVWTFMYGQSVEFNTKRKALVIMLQIWIFMLIVLGNAYQGLITSFMIAEPEPSRMKSFDEVLESELKLMVAEGFHVRINSNYLYKKAFDQGRVIIDKGIETFDFAKPRIEKCAVVVSCDQANFMDLYGLAPNFYVLSEKIFPYYIQFQAVYLSKVLKRWQLIMDWSFESGLTKAWDRFGMLVPKIAENIIEVDDTLDDIIRLGDISIVFYALLIGCILALFSLFCEILWHKYIGPYLEMRKHLKEIESLRKDFLRELKARKIKVRPAEIS